MQSVMFSHRNKIQKYDVKSGGNREYGILEIDGVQFSVDWPVFQFIMQLLEEREDSVEEEK